jgi:hypothetical protein
VRGAGDLPSLLFYSSPPLSLYLNIVVRSRDAVVSQTEVRCLVNRRSDLRLESGGSEDAVLLVLSTWVASLILGQT